MKGLEEHVEQLAFGLTMPRISACLGLYISTDVVFLCEVRMTGGKPTVGHLLRVPVPQSPTARETRMAGTLNTDMLADPGKLVGILKPVLSQVKWGTNFVCVSISHHLGLLRYFNMPGIDRRYWKTAIPAEAKKYIPIQFADLTADFQVNVLPPGPDRKPRQSVLFGVTHRKNIEGINALCRKLDYGLVGVEMAPISVARLWDQVEGVKPPPPYAQVHFDGGRVRMLISEGGMPIFFREVFLGAEASLQDLRKIDLGGCIDFTRKQLGAQPPAQLRVSGSLPNIDAWKDALAAEAGLPARTTDAAKALGLKAGDWGGYAAIGSALRHLAPTPLTLDLSQSRRISDEDRNAATGLFTVAGLVAAFFLAIGGFQNGRAYLKSQELARLRSSGSTLPIFQGKTNEQILSLIKDMEGRSNIFYSLIGPKTQLTHALEDLSDNVPDALWLTSLKYNAALGEGQPGQTQRGLEIAGHVTAAAPIQEQDLAIQFRDKLWSNERFGKTWACSGASVRANPSPTRAAETTLDPEQILEEREKRTTFSIDCQAKRS